jgi:type II secretory pathway pseudopilin PulG
MSRAAFKNPRFGMSLVEVVVAAGLFVVLGLVVFNLLKWGLKGSEMGRLNMDAQQQGRQALKRIKDELGTATRLNIPVPTASPKFGSPVLFPSPLEKNGQFSANRNFFSDNVSEPAKPKLFGNEVVFVAAAQSAAAMDVTQSANYRLVRYFVPSTARNFLVRQVYPLSGLTGLTVLSAGNARSPGTVDTWTADIDYAYSGSPVFRQGLKGLTLQEETALIELPASDMVQFDVSHEAVDSGRDSFNANFNRLLFRVEARVSRFYQGDRLNKAAFKDFSDSVALPDFVQ